MFLALSQCLNFSHTVEQFFSAPSSRSKATRDLEDTSSHTPQGACTVPRASAARKACGDNPARRAKKRLK